MVAGFGGSAVQRQSVAVFENDGSELHFDSGAVREAGTHDAGDVAFGVCAAGNGELIGDDDGEGDFGVNYVADLGETRV